jgi:hypothetical protein
MNYKHLIYIIPLCLVLGYLFGLYFNLPTNITIDTGVNLKELSLVMQNITTATNNYCHNLTFVCNCTK